MRASDSSSLHFKRRKATHSLHENTSQSQAGRFKSHMPDRGESIYPPRATEDTFIFLVKR